MVAKIDSFQKKAGTRVFVLVDKGVAQGVFNSWDAATTYANENHFSLEHLMEYETHPDHPTHLHLLAAKWAGKWEFVGKWTFETPAWSSPPQYVRMDHYHAKGAHFDLLRQKEFQWKEGLLGKVNLMAPDSALITKEILIATPAKWTPRLSPIRSPGNPSSVPKASEQAESEVNAPQDSVVEPHNLGEKKKSKVSFKKGNPLKLKTEKLEPKPVPLFKSDIPPYPYPTILKRSTATSTQVEEAEVQEATIDSPHKIIQLRIIIPVVTAFICWGLGIFYVFQPEPPPQNNVADIPTLAKANYLIIEPGQIFFQLPVDPINQRRWVKSLDLAAIPKDSPIRIPKWHALETWENPDSFIRAPFADVEVIEWWDLRLRVISLGFYREWNDGSIIILDLESDMLIAWSDMDRLRDLLN